VAYTRNYTITTTRQVILPVDGSAQEVHIHSTSGKVYIGGADVTVDNGLALDNGEKMILTIHPNDAIYAVCNAGTVGLSVLWLVR
jgi:hypothetical protein